MCVQLFARVQRQQQIPQQFVMPHQSVKNVKPVNRRSNFHQTWHGRGCGCGCGEGGQPQLHLPKARGGRRHWTCNGEGCSYTFHLTEHAKWLNRKMGGGRLGTGKWGKGGKAPFPLQCVCGVCVGGCLSINFKCLCTQHTNRN